MQLARILALAPALALVVGLAGGGVARADDADPPPPPIAPLPPVETPAPAPAPAPPPPEPRIISTTYLPVQTPPAAIEAETSEPTTKTIRLGSYTDDDQTTVRRLFAAVGHAFGAWQTNASFTVDAVTSASVDVRSSPDLSKVDTVTSASGRSSTSGGQMTDTRYQLTGGLGWKDTLGHAINATGAVATETDYASVSGGLNGSYDILDRNATLLGGLTVTDNWVSSVLDSSLHRKMLALGWSAGIARVLTRDDAVRLRYDGHAGFGYLSSPYRSVRFGDWMATQTSHVITFSNTIGDPAGLAENVPERRVSHALVAEWVHYLGLGIGVHPEVRVAHDSWGIDSLSAGADLRIAYGAWRASAGYRYYTQTAADFFLDKYTSAPDAYTNYTSDKELGHERGHTGRLHLACILQPAKNATDTNFVLDAQVEILDYRYPGFTLLPQRDGTFISVGLGTELP